MKRTTQLDARYTANRRYQGLCIRAALLFLAYGSVHILGWRESTGFLSGTMAENRSLNETVIRGTLYLLAHLGFWVLAPVLTIGAGLTVLDDRWSRGRKGGAIARKD